MHPTKERIHKSLHYLPGAGLVYLSSPKSGCSTVKASLWKWHDRKTGEETFLGDPHARGYSPFNKTIEQVAQDIDAVMEATVFTVVRNPFARILSAYLDKVANAPPGALVWSKVAPDLGFAVEDRPSFGDFLKRLATVDPDTVNAHFAPQAGTTLAHYVRPDFLGYLERFDAVGAFLFGHGIEVADHVPHQTGAAEKVARSYSGSDIDLVRSYCADDFAIFGYSMDPADMPPVRPAQYAVTGKAGLRKLVQDVCPRRGGMRGLSRKLAARR